MFYDSNVFLFCKFQLVPRFLNVSTKGLFRPGLRLQAEKSDGLHLKLTEGTVAAIGIISRENPLTVFKTSRWVRDAATLCREKT